MISQASSVCVCVCGCECAALGAVLLGVVDRDNEAMTEAQSQRWEEKERKARADSACELGSVCIL